MGGPGPFRWIRHWFGSEVIVTWPSTTTSPSEFVVIYLNDSHIIVNWKLSESGNRSEKKRHWIEVSNYQYLKNDFSANSTKTDKNEWNDLWQKSDRNAPLALSVFKANGIMPLMTGHQQQSYLIGQTGHLREFQNINWRDTTHFDSEDDLPDRLWKRAVSHGQKRTLFRTSLDNRIIFHLLMILMTKPLFAEWHTNMHKSKYNLCQRKKRHS